MDSQPDEGRRALAFMNRLDEAVASEVREWRLGPALVTPELPRVWDASYFRVERPDDDAERVAAETVEIAGAAGLAHCAVVLTDDEIADELGPGLESAGFEEMRYAVMGLREAPPPPELAIAEVSFEDVAASRRRITLEFFPGDEALADQLGVLDRRLEATIGGRWFAVREGGEPAARAWLLGSDAVGQVEDVATAPDRRRTGLARAVVSAAARASLEAGNELTFVVVNDGHTTPELYRKTGFEPVGSMRRFVKRLR